MIAPMQIAQDYISRGWAPIPIPFRKKSPVVEKWTKLNVYDGNVSDYFGDHPQNVGVLLGEPSGDLADIDLDCEEAMTMASQFLPATNSIFGRRSRPASHWLYSSPVATTKFLDPSDKTTILECRSTGCQTVFPGSVHPAGEEVVWYEDGSVTTIEPGALLGKVKIVAAGALLARHWPDEGGRHDAQLTLIAFLIRSGWSEEEAAQFTAAVSTAAGGDPDIVKRRSTAEDAFRRLNAGESLRGWPAFEVLFDPKVAAKAAEWLEISMAAKSTYYVSDHDQNNSTKLDVGSDVEIARCMTEELKSSRGEVVFCEGCLWYFSETHWQPVAESELRRIVHRYDGVRYKSSSGKGTPVRLSRGRIDSIINEFAAILDEPEFFAVAPAGINCTSGFIEFDEQGGSKLKPHDSNYRARHIIPGKWPATITDEEAENSLLFKLLNGCFGGDEDAREKIDLLAELAGAAALGVATRLVQPKAVVLLGVAAENGKSQVLDVLRGFLPADAVAAVSPIRFSDEKYLIQLAGKLLNASDELTSSSAVSSDVFKQIITGEPITARDVYRPAINFRCKAQHVFATNQLPSFHGGMDRGVRRRLMVITFNLMIPLEERIPEIGRLVCAQEPDHILDWAVEGASRLIRQGGFTTPASSAESLREWFLGADPVLAWLEEAVEVDPTAPAVPCGAAYRAFKTWAIEEGFHAERLPAVHVFVQRVKAADKKIVPYRTAHTRYLRGLRILKCAQHESRTGNRQTGTR